MEGIHSLTLVQGTNYYFYGMTMDGGAGGNGTIYRVSSTGDFKVLVNFGGPMEVILPTG